MDGSGAIDWSLPGLPLGNEGQGDRRTRTSSMRLELFYVATRDKVLAATIQAGTSLLFLFGLLVWI